MAALLDHAAIAARVPHRGPMCLLDAVTSWDAAGIDCTSRRHRAVIDGKPHPLARDGRLPATAAIEFAAQAMAVHGALVAESASDVAEPAPERRPRPGVIAAVRSVTLERRWIAEAAPELLIRARRFAGNADQVIYDFEVMDGQPLARGRVIVLLESP